jgi:hypothetical protein
MNDNSLQIFWKNNFRQLFSSSPRSSSFLVYFEWFKAYWVHQLWIYKTSLYSKNKDAIIKDFKLEILGQIYFNSPITKH